MSVNPNGTAFQSKRPIPHTLNDVQWLLTYQKFIYSSINSNQ